MSYTTVKKISLDIYNNSIVYINAKQNDSNSRYIEVTCTEYGKKIVLNNNDTRAYVGYTKPDGHFSANEATVLENGNILIELTSQMLSVKGRCVADVILASKDIEGLLDTESRELLIYNSSALSTMSFYVNVLTSAVEQNKMESSDEYGVFERVIGLELTVEENEANRNEAEKLRNIAENGEYDETGNLIKDGRVQAEIKRVDNENARIEAEKQRDEAENGEFDQTGNLIKDGRVQAEKKRDDAETNRAKAEESRVIAETKRNEDVKDLIDNCQTKVDTKIKECGDKTDEAILNFQTEVKELIDDAEVATERANNAAQNCENIVAGVGVVMQTEKGASGGVASLDETGKVPEEQLPYESEGENSFATNDSAVAIGAYSFASGENSIAGCKGYYIKSIDMTSTEKKIYLYNGKEKPDKPEISDVDNTDPSFETSYAEGDVFNIINGSHYVLCGTITSIEHNVIKYSGDLGFTTIAKDEDPEGHTLFVPRKPQVGLVVITNNSNAIGENAIAAGRSGYAEGRDVLVAGNYGHAEGRNTVAGYAAHAEGVNTDATGLYSHSESQNTVSLGSASHAEGRFSQALGKASHAEGGVTNTSYNHIASGDFSHVEGENNSAAGEASHAEGYKTKAQTDYSHAEGRETIASGEASHAEGFKTSTLGKYAHSEGNDTMAEGNYSHAEGVSTNATGIASHAEGNNTTASGSYSHAEGQSTKATGYYTHAEGNGTTASGEGCNASGYKTQSKGQYTHAEGDSTIASARASHAEGCNTKAASNYAHAEGNSTTASGEGSHAEGYLTKASGKHSHAEGSGYYDPEESEELAYQYTIASGDYAHAEGSCTEASSDCSHAEGSRTIASGSASHAEGSCTEAIGFYSHAEGNSSYAYAESSHAEGQSEALGMYAHSEGNSTAEGLFSHAEGYSTYASKEYSHAEGLSTKTDRIAQHVQGMYNLETQSDEYYLSVVGNGSSTNRSNAYILDSLGNAWYSGYVQSLGSDYAEYFEWADSNPNADDRVGYIVALDGEKIRLASQGDEVLGIISGTVAVLGDSYECEWNGKYLRDEFGRVIYDSVEEFTEVSRIETDENGKPKLDESGKPIRVKETKSLGFFKRPRLNPEYDPTQSYVNRNKRPEWDAVGMLGKLFVRDDGTAEVNGYITVGENGIATKSEEKTNMRVLSRVNENIIRVLLK